MDLFEELRRETIQAQNYFELPDFLAERIFRIAGHPHAYRHCRDEIAQLSEQVRQYDTYGQTGYLGMGVNHVILEGTLRRLEARRSAPEW